MRRENTVRIKKEDVQRLQCHRGEQCAFVKVSDLTIAQKIVQEHDGRHEVEINDKKYKLRITMEEGSVEVKLHDLPENVSETNIVDFLSAFGEVISIHKLTWGENHDFAGIPLGIWSARMIITQNIDSWVTIDGQQGYIVYKGQLQSCKHCKERAHTGISCVQNKKLLVQKSYANVTKLARPRQPAKKTDSVKPTNPKPAGQRPTAPPPVASNAFPQMPKPSSQNEPSDSDTNTQTGRTERTASPSPQPQRSQGSSSSHRAQQPGEASKQSAKIDDFFKKPANATRSQSKGGNGTETDESYTSTSSKRTRSRPPGKKPRRDEGDEEQKVETHI